MAASFPVRAGTVRANDLEFGLLEAGSGPLALCLHGFPDTAHTWEQLLPVLAGAGFHAVAPFMRGYAPSAVPADGAYQVGALAADALALHQVLGGDGDAVLIGHDWGAEAAYGAAAYAPDRWRRLVTLAVPPAALDPVLFSDYEQLKRFFYVFMFRDPLGFADAVVARDGMSFLDKLWHDWSPGYQPGKHLTRVKDCLREPANLAAAIGYYRAAGVPDAPIASAGTATRYAGEQQAAGRQAPQPTLYLHGAADGCIRVELARGAERLLAPSSRMIVIDDARHFLHLEKPDEVNNHILAWVSS
ncbi:MAG TPA: alpha/beta hydrolase [Streptosporangiaceae bacterium]|nr:alpha/beta hydrolase [Streptosporangiaceae bacterium]